ncbi:hypothetical protein CYMTET_47414 [Cymbomonas tetramitiformis]|uniref:Uncharacterized protein n=1 Tax=Cymbomonas tetramitiformis TaxID=36881 RepID=A0AAE0BVT0_9CHLO|nr:hypothetical protein CYMTET_47414 [Cymbomonas tetramitiformis]
MQDHEEDDEFDLAAFDEAEEFEQLDKELQDNDDYRTTTLITRTGGCVTTTSLHRVEGKKYPSSDTPVLHVRVASIEEARVLIEYAVIVADNQDFLITPKGSKLTSITLGFKAVSSGKQPKLPHILSHIKASPFSRFIKEITFQQTFTVHTRVRGGKKRSRLVRQIFVLLKSGLGRHPEPARIDKKNKEHAMYALPLEYHWSGLGTVFISKCSALICRECEGKAANGHGTKNCPVRIYGEHIPAVPAAQTLTAAAQPEQGTFPPGCAEGTDQSTAAHTVTRPATQRHGGHPPNCSCSACKKGTKRSLSQIRPSPSPGDCKKNIGKDRAELLKKIAQVEGAELQNRYNILQDMDFDV